MKLFHALLLSLGLLLGGQAAAADVRPFSQPLFEQLQAEGTPVLVDVYADWCPMCKRQEAVLTPMLVEPAFADLTLLKLDFDSQKEALKAFGVRRQITLILFRDGEELARVLGETDPARLRTFVEQAY